MKSIINWMSGMMVAVMLLALLATKAQAQDDYVSYQTFYDELSPYGQWVNDPQYGNVWVPDAGNDFRPYYTNGYWAMTDYGNTWVSNYAWGWAPFHYGRWTHNPFYGWIWVPGNTWGPAWVSWRWGGGNAGWAPMAPGISLSMSFGNYNYPNDWWVFVGPQYMYQPNFHNHWRGPRYNSTYINQTTIINNTYNNTYVYGPRANEIERVTHQRVNTHRIGRGERGRTVVTNNAVNIYRPSVRGSASEGQPRNVVRAPREIGQPQGGVRNTRSEFKTMVARGQVTPVSSGTRNGLRDNNGVRQQPGREQRFDSRQDRTNQARPLQSNDRGRIEQQDRQLQRVERQQPQRIERQQPDRQQMQSVERPQPQRQQPQRIERQQPQRQQPQRMERPQPQRQQPQRIERPQPQRQQPQRIERQQPQRMERPQPQRQQPQRTVSPQPQRMERATPQARPQAAPRPQPQRQAPAQSSPRSGGERGGRR